MITVYSLPNCQGCDRCKSELDQNNIEFTEVIVNKDITSDELKAKFPGVNYVPIIAIKNHQIGGIDELMALIKNDQIKYLL